MLMKPMNQSSHARVSDSRVRGFAPGSDGLVPDLEVSCLLVQDRRCRKKPRQTRAVGRSSSVSSARAVREKTHAHDCPPLFALMANEPSPATYPATNARSASWPTIGTSNGGIRGL